MPAFKFCELCMENAPELENGNSLSPFKPCKGCIQRREEYVDRIRRDKAYRSHLARQMEGYPCDITSQCPHHSPDYQYFEPSEDWDETMADTEMGLVCMAFSKVKRHSSLFIIALELLSGHHSSMVKYCTKCYACAIAGFEENAQIPLCQDCLERRESFIERAHRHQNTFAEPWEEEGTTPDNVLRLFEVNTSSDWEYDRYLELHVFEIKGGGGISPDNTSTIVFGVLGCVGTISTIAVAVYYARKQLKAASQDRLDVERSQQAHDLALTQPNPIPTSGVQFSAPLALDGQSISSFHTAQSHN
jgi:hypothetical protein